MESPSEVGSTRPSVGGGHPVVGKDNVRNPASGALVHEEWAPPVSSRRYPIKVGTDRCRGAAHKFGKFQLFVVSSALQTAEVCADACVPHYYYSGDKRGKEWCGLEMYVRERGPQRVTIVVRKGVIGALLPSGVATTVPCYDFCVFRFRITHPLAPVENSHGQARIFSTIVHPPASRLP